MCSGPTPPPRSLGGPLSPATPARLCHLTRPCRSLGPGACPSGPCPHMAAPPPPPSEQTRRQWLDSKRTPCLKGTCLPSPLPSCTSAPVSSVGRPSSWGQAQPAPSRPEKGTSVVHCEVPPSTKNRAPLWPSNPSSGCPLINLKTFAHGSIAHGGREVETFGRGRTG